MKKCTHLKIEMSELNKWSIWDKTYNVLFICRQIIQIESKNITKNLSLIFSRRHISQKWNMSVSPPGLLSILSVFSLSQIDKWMVVKAGHEEKEEEEAEKKFSFAKQFLFIAHDEKRLKFQLNYNLNATFPQNKPMWNPCSNCEIKWATEKSVKHWINQHWKKT